MPYKKITFVGTKNIPNLTSPEDSRLDSMTSKVLEAKCFTMMKAKSDWQNISTVRYLYTHRPRVKPLVQTIYDAYSITMNIDRDTLSRVNNLDFIPF